MATTDNQKFIAGPNAITPTDIGLVKKTGWAAWTGTATRTTVATGAATTASNAEAIKALIDDLIALGLIGA